ncbi:hypothetical protein FK535_14260 [Mycolicibacterium sp. 018/SC-01/001]|uniref:hypothetical protein n=1 Tax=Mycolicibacterium sp. 018/SC-01/001 TaxID=2592069 RepID=UPI00117F6B5E|nr:hypothetical protein [Mycolicibacterium sp. 018/SC-01/001]TRW82047.1 hypothetical protein FK535_14260 [Mycolicibacterium sp. 018/SC-01/001]
MSDDFAQPPRGRSRDELGPDVSAAQQQATESSSTTRRMMAALHPGFLWSQAEGYPPVLKQLLQFGLIVAYPAWVAGMLCCLAVHCCGYAVLWVVFWPVRAWMKRNRPLDYAASQNITP